MSLTAAVAVEFVYSKFEKVPEKTETFYNFRVVVNISSLFLSLTSRFSASCAMLFHDNI